MESTPAGTTPRTHHYDTAQLEAALAAAGLAEGDIALTHVGLGMLGFPREGRTEEAMYRVVRDAFLGVLGRSGTLLVPAYSYTFCRGEDFDPDAAPSSVGPFTERFRKEPGVVRSLEPIFSVAGLGPAAAGLFAGLPRECFGADCLYERLIRSGAKICNIGVGFRYATFIHHIEQREAVPYRFLKKFSGRLRREGRWVSEEWLYNVRQYVDNTLPDLRRLEADAAAQGGFLRARVGRGEVTLVRCADMDRFCTEGIRRDPWYMAKGPAVDIEQAQASLCGVVKPALAPDPDGGPESLLRALAPLPAYPLSLECEAVRERLCEGLPVRVLSCPTGARSGTRVVPERWVCRDAFLEGEDGARLASLRDDPLLASYYSRSCDERLDLADLGTRLRTHPIAAAVPLSLGSSHLQWSLCCSRDFVSRLKPGRYRARIDAAFLFGSFTVGECLAEGGGKDLVAVVAHTDHCGMANDALSGAVAAAAALRRRVQAAGRGQGILALFLPRTLGLPWWFRTRPELSARVRALLFVESMGVEAGLFLQHPASQGGAWHDAVASSMAEAAPGSREAAGDGPWLAASDLEGLPAGVPAFCLNRSRDPLDREAPYPGFRTSLETPDLVSPRLLGESADLLGRFFDRLDAAHRRRG